MRSRVLHALKVTMGNYFEQKLTFMWRSIVQQITEGSSNFRMEIEGHLSNAENTFEKLNSDLRNAMSQVALKFSENDGKSAKFEGMLQALLEQNQQTQQVLERERRNRELENKDVSLRITQICQVLEQQQQQLLAANHQTIKDELIQEVAKKMECGAPSKVKKEIEVKKEPPGLSMGGDDRGLGVKRDPPFEGTDEKGPKEITVQEKPIPKRPKG